MGLRSAIANWIAPAESARAQAGPQWPKRTSAETMQLTGGALRGFMAASNDRLVADLASLAGMVSGNAEVRMGLRTMRQRSRALSQDNEYVKRFLQLIRNGVVGPRGFDLQMKIYKPRKVNGLSQLDKDANDTIEIAYRQFSRVRQFSACGRLSRAAFERAIITSVARDGEVLIEMVFGRQYKFGLTWRLLDPDLLDENLNVGAQSRQGGVQLAPGHSIRMGVERDAYARPVAYWLLQAHPADDVVSTITTVRHRRVPADRIIHAFLAEELRPDVARGVPWLYAGIRRMAMLGGYEEAALVNARAGAAKMGFYKRPATDPQPGSNLPADGSAVADLEDETQGLMAEAEAGVFGVLPAGWDFQAYDPAYPNDAMDGFVMSMLRAFASGVGLTYNTLTGDLKNVSMSSLRQGANADRDTYEALQEWFRDHIGLPMFEAWLENGLLQGAIGRLPPDAFERLNFPRLVSRAFRSTDPQKDISANAQAVALGTRSRTRICADNGEDFEEVLDELAREEEMARQKRVTLNTQAATAHKNPAADNAGKPMSPGAESSGEAEQETDEPEAVDD